MAPLCLGSLLRKAFELAQRLAMLAADGNERKGVGGAVETQAAQMVRGAPAGGAFSSRTSRWENGMSMLQTLGSEDRN
jgi:hypothetical protein